MGKLYDKIDEEEILFKDLVLPETFPAIYIDEYDEVYCYFGIIDNNRFLFESYPYWLQSKKPSEVEEHVRGYFRIKNGLILNDKNYLDEIDSFNIGRKCKKLQAFVQLPNSNNMPYGVYYKEEEEIQSELSRKVFGLSYKDLSELIYHYNKFFEIVPQNYYSRYPSITRSIKNDNYCDITNMWIPENFPYIAFQGNGYYYSHISIYGFCQQVKFMTQNYIESSISKKLIADGLNPQILEKLFNTETHSHNSVPIDRYRVIELHK